MKILATGGLGFIGSNLCERLVREGHEVTIIDNMHTGSEANVESIRSRVRIVVGRAKQLVEIGEKFEVIFHEGIYSSTPMYKEKPERVAEVVEDFIAILEYARKNGTKIVYASSSSVYNGIEPPQREDAPIGVTDFYTEARVAMERLAELYHKLYGVSAIGLRYFSVYGPNEENKKSYANLISQFIWAIRKGEQPVVYGDGSQKRDFTYVDDIVEANMLAMESKIGLGVFNAGTGKAITINEMIELLNKKMGTNLNPKYIPNPISNYVHYTLADTKKAEKELGFKAKVSLDEGIGKLIGAQ